MKRALKILVYIILITVVAVGGSLTYIKKVLPSVGHAEDLKIEYMASASGCVE